MLHYIDISNVQIGKAKQFDIIAEPLFSLDAKQPAPVKMVMRKRLMKPSKINIMEKFLKLPDEDYSVRIIAMMNNYEFKIVKFKGEFIWHSHPDTDEPS